MLKMLAGWPRTFLLAAALLAPAMAQAFGPGNAGVYAVFDQKGQQTDVAYRFYLRNDKWVAEERAADGSWAPFVCKSDCEITPMSPAEVTIIFGPSLNLFEPSCISNSNFAVCTYTGKKDPKSGFLMVVKTPEGKVVLVHLGLLAIM